MRGDKHTGGLCKTDMLEKMEIKPDKDGESYHFNKVFRVSSGQGHSVMFCQ